MTEQDKQQARENAQTYADLQGIPYVDPFPETPVAEIPVVETPIVETPIVEIPVTELSDEQLLQALDKRGIKTSKLEDLLPKPSEAELEVIRAKRESDKLAYGLSTGKFKKEDYDAFLKAQENKMGVIKSDMAEKIKIANPDFTPEQVEEQIGIYTLSNLPADNILRIQREQELIELADSKLQKKFSNIVNLDSDFDQHQQGITNRTNFERKVQAALPVYKSDLKSVLTGLGTLETSVNDTQNPENNVPIKVTFSEKDLQEVEEALLQPEQIYRQIKDGYTVESIREEAETVLLKKHWPRLISQAAKDYNSTQKDKYLKARHGLMPAAGEIDVSDDKLLTENQQVYQQLIDSESKPTASSN